MYFIIADFSVDLKQICVDTGCGCSTIKITGFFTLQVNLGYFTSRALYIQGDTRKETEDWFTAIHTASTTVSQLIYDVVLCSACVRLDKSFATLCSIITASVLAVANAAPGWVFIARDYWPCLHLLLPLA